MLPTIRRRVWSGSSELAEIQVPATDSTLADTVKNDELAIEHLKPSTMAKPEYDANRIFRLMLYVHGLATDQPVSLSTSP